MLAEMLTSPVGPLTGPCTGVLVLVERGWFAGQYSQYHVQVSPESQRAVALSVADPSVTFVAPVVLPAHALSPKAAPSARTVIANRRARGRLRVSRSIR